MDTKNTKPNKNSEITGQELQKDLTILAALGGHALPQNNKYQKANEPIPEDIRANKKDGDEYDTIEDAFKKGGIRKVIVLIFAALLAGYLLFGGLAIR